MLSPSRISCRLAPLAMSLAAAASLAAATLEQYEPHDFDRQNRGCAYCHVKVGAKTRSALLKPVSVICGECHASDGKQHPVDIDTALDIPADLPLDAHGKLTCATCHNVHRPRIHPSTGERTMYLRRDGPRKQFCEACHTNGIFRVADTQ